MDLSPLKESDLDIGEKVYNAPPISDIIKGGWLSCDDEMGLEDTVKFVSTRIGGIVVERRGKKRFYGQQTADEEVDRCNLYRKPADAMKASIQAWVARLEGDLGRAAEAMQCVERLESEGELN